MQCATTWTAPRVQVSTSSDLFAHFVYLLLRRRPPPPESEINNNETLLYYLPVAEDGALLPSPTIDKLMPALPRSREGSPKKTIASRHGSPQKGSPKKLSKMAHKGRSQSVGANHVADGVANGTATNGGSPKRQLRSAVTIEDVKDGGPAVATKPAKDTKVTINLPGERRPRPSEYK